ncbi:MAG TPA: GMC family oxidoreductase [Vicinamibacterales bacterium]|jgi:choline dehydrogenase-like flavoprotein|nr:GMC family oxidoreductase [Vicinamibacterales bacterium]
MQIISSRRIYDVCIVGSGAGGGMAAKVLTEAGADVLMLEAGPNWDPVKDSKMFAWNYDSPRRGASIPERQFGEYDAALGGWTLDGEPYTTAPGEEFLWFRSRMLGGRTNHWGRISLRWGPDDFRPRRLDGLGDDWPITYDDIRPFYDEVDKLVGVFGTNLGPRFPNEPDGLFLPPPQPRCYELLIRDASERLNIPCVPARLSILTKPLNGRPACHYCGQCNRGCATGSNFQSTTVLIPPAMKTGRLTLITDAMAREVTIGDDALVNGVAYIDKKTGRDNHARARVVVLAASACETARLLLNSKSGTFPQGLANSSGVVGKYLTDSTGVGVSGFIPRLTGNLPHNEDGVGGMHLYMPWWLDNSTLDFPRGYHIEIGGGRRMPGAGFLGNLYSFTGVDASGTPISFGGYGKTLKQDYRRVYGSVVSFAGRGAMIPNDDCYCDVDPLAVDKYGIPVLRFHWKWSDYEKKQAKHMQETFSAIIHEMGGTPLEAMSPEEANYGLAAGGEIIHELGVARMGDDPSTSVVNKYCQAHDVKNLFIADGAPFVTQADKNCTWTILALSMRTSQYIADQRRAGAI